MPWTVLDPAAAAAAPVTTAGAPLTSVGETFLSLRTSLKSQLANRADANTTKLGPWVNRAYRHLCAMLPLPELNYSFGFNLILGQPAYNLPVTAAGNAAVSAIYKGAIENPDLYRNGGAPLEFISEKQYRDLPVRDDDPRAFLRHRSMVVFWPTPTTARSVVFDGRIRPQDLVADTDSPFLPIEWHEAILLAARYRALRDLREWKESAIANNDFVAYIRTIRDEAAEEQANQEVHMVPLNSKTLIRGGSLMGSWPEDN